MTGRLPSTERLDAELPDPTRHLDFVTSLYADPEIARWHWPGILGGRRTAEQSRAMLSASLAGFESHGFGTWLWREREGGELVARAGLNATEIENGLAVIEVGWSVPVAHQGRGFATEAALASIGFGLGDRGLGEIVSFTMVDNAASRRVMDKAGLIYRRDFRHVDLPHVLYATPQPTSTNARNAP